MTSLSFVTVISLDFLTVGRHECDPKYILFANLTVEALKWVSCFKHQWLLKQQNLFLLAICNLQLTSSRMGDMETCTLQSESNLIASSRNLIQIAMIIYLRHHVSFSQPDNRITLGLRFCSIFASLGERSIRMILE